MDASNFVDDIAQQVAALHAVVDTLENRGDNVAAIIPVGTGQRPQITKKARPALAV